MSLRYTLIVTFLLSINFYGCSKGLPVVYSDDSFSNSSVFLEEPILLGNNGPYTLIYVPVQGTMAYSSSNNHIGLYENKILKKEMIIGSIPLKLKSWNDNVIILTACGQNKEYLDSWLIQYNNCKIGKFIIKFDYEIQ